jgi:hypothetical protein
VSLARKLALVSAGAWLIITVALVAIFFLHGPDTFSAPENRGPRALIAGIILPGYALNFAILFRTRRGRQRGDLDERDRAVERTASQTTLITMLLVFFLASIGLYEHFRTAGAVPVGWLYLMAYGSVALVSLLHPTVSLIIDYNGRTDA